MPCAALPPGLVAAPGLPPGVVLVNVDGVIKAVCVVDPREAIRAAQATQAAAAAQATHAAAVAAAAGAARPAGR